jgi:putative tryptophan/tyrosine transport system substrate-binding protein
MTAFGTTLTGADAVACPQLVEADIAVFEPQSPDDPKPTKTTSKSRSAAVSCRIEVCYPSGRKDWRHCAVKRREFITLLGGATAWPLAVSAQQPTAMPVIGFLNVASADPYAPMVAAFRQGLKEAGYVEGQNVAIEYRWVENQYDRLPALAADLVRRKVAVIVSNNPATQAAKVATTTIPIVFVSGADPVAVGLIASFNRPGGNLTGVTFITGPLGVKRLGLLHDAVPTASTIGMLVNPTFPDADFQLKDAQAAAIALGLRLHVQRASTERDIDMAFGSLVQQRVGALLVGGSALFLSRRDRFTALAARHAIPAIYDLREYVAAGGLMSYGASITDSYRQAGIYAGRVLRGANLLRRCYLFAHLDPGVLDQLRPSRKL